jgi:hypothetical protein
VSDGAAKHRLNGVVLCQCPDLKKHGRQSAATYYVIC